MPHHHGNLVASNNQYLAYILEGRTGYVLRVIHQPTNNRALLKGFTGAVVDVAFAHANSNFLACVDQGGNLFIWDLDRVEDISQIQQYPPTWQFCNRHFIEGCMYLTLYQL